MSRTTRRTAGHGELLSPESIAAMRAALPEVAEKTVDAIIAEVPSYAGALSGKMGEIIRNAVQLALGGFLSLASGRRGADPGTPTAPAVEGAYQLGRGEARNGRSTEALLSAYRIGARVSWREMSKTAVTAGVPAETIASFAELVFAYIDELSAASVSGHSDELASTGRVRERLLERLAQHLLDGSPSEEIAEAATRAEWPMPSTLTAVLVPEAQVRPIVGALPASTLHAVERREAPDRVILLVPDMHGSARAALLAVLADRGCVAGPARPWLSVPASVDRAARVHQAGLLGDTEQHLTALILGADPEALADLRLRVLAPLASLRPAVAEKLTETLRSWLIHHGRRDEVAEALFVHPQTVRYRLGQLRDLYGDQLEDPDTVVALTIALA